MMIPSFQSFIKSWFIHLIIFLVILNLFDSIDYLVRLNGGLYYTNPDGTPVTLWQRFIHHNFQRADNLYLLVFTFLAEVNYQFIYNRLRWPAFLVLTVVLSLAILFIYFSCFRAEGSTQGYLMAWLPVAGYVVGYVLIKTFLRQGLYRLQVRLNHSQNEMELLKHQLNPHFFFNTLNYLYGTALHEDANRTAAGIEMTSNLMRHTLTGLKEIYVTLASEITFFRQYLELQTIRLAVKDQASITIDIKETNEPLKIAPMLLIPFIENAFKYMYAESRIPFIAIQLAVHDGKLQLNVKNSKPQSTDTDDNYLSFVEPGTYTLTRMTLGEALKKLPAGQFCRIHKSYVVNLRYVEKIRSDNVVIGKVSIPISRSKFQELRLKLT